MNTAPTIHDLNDYTKLKNPLDPNIKDVNLGIEGVLNNMSAREEEFMEGVDSTDEKADSAKPGFFAGLDLQAHKAGNIVHLALAPLVWVFLNSLLAGTVGFVCGPPGAGKSTFLIYIAASIATGMKWFGDHLVPGGKGKVLAVFCEEDERILWRRIILAFKAFNSPWPHVAPGSLSSFVSHNFEGNIFAVPAAGQDVRLIKSSPGGEPQPSQAFEELLALAKSIPDLKLIILDPLSRLYGQNENDNSMATYFCSLLEQLAQETGAAVLVNHHVGKGAGYDRNGNFNVDAAMSPDVIRGASAITGAARWQLNLFSLDAKTARKELKDPAAKNGEYLVARVSKKNYGPPESKFYLQRGEGGVLCPVAVPDEEEKKELFEQLTEKIIAVVRDREEAGKTPLTIKLLKEAVTAPWKTEIPGVSQGKVAAAAHMAVADGKLFLVNRKAPGGKTSADYLSTTPDTEEEACSDVATIVVDDAGQDAGRGVPEDAGQNEAHGVNTPESRDIDAGKIYDDEDEVPNVGTRAKLHAGRRVKTTPKGDTADRPASAVLSPQTGQS